MDAADLKVTILRMLQEDPDFAALVYEALGVGVELRAVRAQRRLEASPPTAAERVTRSGAPVPPWLAAKGHGVAKTP